MVEAMVLEVVVEVLCAQGSSQIGFAAVLTARTKTLGGGPIATGVRCVQTDITPAVSLISLCCALSSLSGCTI